MDKAGIESVIQIYFDSSYELDKDKAWEVFHPDANIYSVGESGSLMVMTVEAFVGIFDQLESHVSHGRIRLYPLILPEKIPLWREWRCALRKPGLPIFCVLP